MGTHLTALSKSFPMNTYMTGFKWFSKVFASDESSLSIEWGKLADKFFSGEEREILGSVRKTKFH